MCADTVKISFDAQELDDLGLAAAGDSNGAADAADAVPAPSSRRRRAVRPILSLLTMRQHRESWIFLCLCILSLLSLMELPESSRDGWCPKGMTARASKEIFTVFSGDQSSYLVRLPAAYICFCSSNAFSFFYSWSS